MQGAGSGVWRLRLLARGGAAVGVASFRLVLRPDLREDIGDLFEDDRVTGSAPRAAGVVDVAPEGEVSCSCFRA